MNISPARGRLVVATPDLSDPNFDGTVVLLLEHEPQGSLGVVLNRPSELLITDAMTRSPSSDETGWDDIADHPPVVFVGGPVRPNALIALARLSRVTDDDRWQPLSDDLGVLDIGEGPVDSVGDVTALRMFAGYAGWGPAQLEQEIQLGSWFVIEGQPTDGFITDPELLWRLVLRRQGGVFTTVTDNPVLN